LLGLFAVFDLQSRQERLRQAAVRNEQRFRSYAEIATDSYFEADATGIVTSAAGALARDLGVVEGEPLAASLAAAAAPAQDDALGQLRQGLRRPQAVRDIELATAGNAGRSLWVSVNLGPHTPTGGELPGVRGTLVDVTERVERRNREARQATLSALGQLAGGVAHEVNNLLHPIVNLARRVRDRTTDAESQHLLDLVVSSGQHAGEIVAGVLNAFNPATPPGPVRPMGPALAEALLAVRATLPAGVQLRETIDLQADLPVLPGEMLQVASNLVSNAVRAMDGHGTIEVTLARDAAGITQLSFKDDGPGMPEAIRGHATEPFVTGRSGGTGLGLSIVAGIVQKWGGDLRIVSAPGAGTTISISIAAPN
jgi:PAS domain S-box-containing protein